MMAPIAALSLKPLAAMDIDDVTLGVKYAYYQFAAAPVGGRSKHAGQEVNGLLTYDYTVDVQFHLLFGYFFRGKYYKFSTVTAPGAAPHSALLEAAVKLTF